MANDFSRQPESNDQMLAQLKKMAASLNRLTENMVTRQDIRHAAMCMASGIPDGERSSPDHLREDTQGPPDGEEANATGPVTASEQRRNTTGQSPRPTASVPSETSDDAKDSETTIEAQMKMIEDDPQMIEIMLVAGDRAPGEKMYRRKIAERLKTSEGGIFNQKLAALREKGFFLPGKGYPLSPMGQKAYERLKGRTKSS